MAITPTRPAVTTAATLIAANTNTDETASKPVHDWATRSFLLKNMTGTASVFVGAGDVTAAPPAFEWAVADGWMNIDLEPGEELWGIVAVTTQTLHVLRQGR
jgi:hypothetical protein